VNASTLKQPQLRESSMNVLDQTTHTLDRFLWILLGIVVVATVASAVFLMVKMDGGVLGAVDSQFGSHSSKLDAFALNGGTIVGRRGQNRFVATGFQRESKT
jgi:hypothetical protein